MAYINNCKVTAPVEMVAASEKVATGEVITVNDVSPIAHNLKVRVNTTNYIPFPSKDITYTDNGNTVTIKPDGNIIVNGDGGIYINVCEDAAELMQALVDNVCYFSCDGLPNEERTECELIIEFADGWRHSYYTNTIIDDYSDLVAEHGEWDTMTVQINCGQIDFDNVVLKPRIQKSAAGVKVTQCGKNLFDISKVVRESNFLKNLVIDEENNSFSFEVVTPNNSSAVEYYTYLPIGIYRLTGNINVPSGKKCGVYIWKPDGSTYGNYAGNGMPYNYITVDVAGVWRFSFYRPYASQTGEIVTYSNVQLEVGKTATDYEKYKGREYDVNIDGTVDGLTSISPNMTLYSDDESAQIECKYIDKMCFKIPASALRLKTK